MLALVDPTRLVLLDGDRIAQRLAAAWPSVERSDELEGAALWSAWARVAGVNYVHVERLGPALMAAGIVEPGGRVADEAMGFLAAVVERALDRQTPTKGRKK